MDNKRMSSKIGLPPGSLIHIGKRRADKVTLTLYRYDSNHFEESKINIIEDFVTPKDKDKINWLNIDGLHDTNTIKKIGESYNLHPLLLEDILNTKHRPKVELFNDYIFITFKMLGYDKNRIKINYEQVSIVLGKNYVLSFQEKQGDIFDPIRERIRNAKGKVREKGADYLVYLLVDIVVDNYFSIVDHIGEEIEALEEKVTKTPGEEFLNKIQKLKRELIFLRKSILPLKDAIGSLEKESEESAAKYFRDVLDHTVNIIEIMETYRDMLTSLLSIYHSNITNKMNNVMKVLTIVATIFIPLTFVTGIYGMNFKYMPELDWKLGYMLVWSIIIGISVTMLIYFKRKKWL